MTAFACRTGRLARSRSNLRQLGLNIDDSAIASVLTECGIHRARGRTP